VLDRYLAGTCSAEEHALVDRWLVADARHAALVAALQTVPPDGPMLKRGIDVNQLWDTVQRRTTADASPAVPQQSGAPRRALRTMPTPWRWALAAGAAGLAIMIGWWSTARTAPRAASTVTTYATRNGQRAEIRLPDGSTVALNVASRLDVPATFNRTHRTVTLTGEALFTVASHAGAPFMVQSGHTTTRVLGTRFVVRRYASDTATIVAVRDGKVAVQSVQSALGSTTLAADEQAQIGRDGIARVSAATPGQFSFASGVLVLDHVPLAVAVADLNRWYDADIHLADSTYGTMPMSGRFIAGSRTSLANTLALTFNARVTLDGRALTIAPR
jgi:transmembrane sensor